MSKKDIEKELEGKGDFVQIDYLTKFLRENPRIDIKKFVYLKLADIYEERGMFNEAAKMLNDAALISIAFSEKIKHYVKEAELYIKSGDFEKVDKAVNKARSNANASQKAEILFAIRDFYKRQAEIYEKEKRRNNASRIYEKLLQMKLSENEKQEIKEKLLELYEKLGKFKEYSVLEKM
jgi:tetratricopeptide (TPR) repeat protein